MSRCDVSVRLDGPAADFVAGAEVTGTVTVLVGEPTEPANLHIRQLWRVHGRGNTHEAVLEERTEVLPRLTPGSPFEVPFRFRAPDRPVSYHGHFVNVDHYVHARVDKPWAKDAVAEADYLVAPGPQSAEAYRLGKSQEATGKTARTPGCLKVIGWVLLPVLVLLLVGLLAMLLPILVVVGIVVLVRRALAEKRLGKVTAEIGAPTVEKAPAYSGPGAGLAKVLRREGSATYIVAPGETVPVTLRFTPPADVNLNGARLDVEAIESATSGSGTDATTHRHVISSQTVTLLDPAPFMRGVPVEVTARLEVPWIGAYSLDVPSNKLTWTARFRIDIPGWPDWVQENELLVIPPR